MITEFVTYVAFGDDGQLHEHPDQIAAEKDYRRSVRRMFGLPALLPEECAHDGKKIFVRGIWLCGRCMEPMRVIAAKARGLKQLSKAGESVIQYHLEDYL